MSKPRVDRPRTLVVQALPLLTSVHLDRGFLINRVSAHGC